MKEILLTQGKVALVDDEDFEYLNQWKWFAHKCKTKYYATRHPERTSIVRMHTILMNPQNKLQVDHINHNGLDNRKENLRIVSHRENQLNLTKCLKNKYPGTQKYYTKYVAKIKITSKTKYIGIYKTPEEARDAYLKKLAQISILNAPMPEL